MFTGGHCESRRARRLPAAGRPGLEQPPLGLGLRERASAVDVVTADGELVHADADAERRPVLGRARRRARASPASSRAFTCARYPPTPMCHDTRVFALDDLEPLLSGCTTCCRALDLARRARDRRDAAAHAASVELLLHTTLDGRRAQAPTRCSRRWTRCRSERGRARARADDDRAGERAQALQNPEGHRYCADCQWTDARRGELAPAAARRSGASCRPEHSFSIWYGWAPTRELPDMAFSLEANVYLATYAIWTDAGRGRAPPRVGARAHARRSPAVGEGVYVGDSDFTRRPDRFMADAQPRRACARSARGARPRRPLRRVSGLSGRRGRRRR